MKIQHLIDEQMNIFHYEVSKDELIIFARKLIEAVGEELINAGDEASDSPGAEFLRAKQRAKLKEIISGFK